MPLVYLAKIIEWTKYSKYSANREKIIVAAHLKHHRFSDQENDPHLPWMTMTPLKKEEVTELTANHKFVYSKLDKILEKLPYGNLVLLAIFSLLWSWEGCILWVINYFVAAWYYRIFNMSTHMLPGYTLGTMPAKCRARNLFLPFAFVFAGEELHGNHHKWPARANYRIKWWEIDFAYVAVTMLSWVKLAQITAAGASKPINGSTEFTRSSINIKELLNGKTKVRSSD